MHVFVLQNGICEMRFIGKSFLSTQITFRTQSNSKLCKVDSDQNNQRKTQWRGKMRLQVEVGPRGGEAIFVFMWTTLKESSNNHLYI